MAGSREDMEGFYLTCEIRPYFPIRLAEAGATGEAGASGVEAGTAIEQAAIDLEAIAQAGSSETLATQYTIKDPPCRFRSLYLLASQWLTWLILELPKWRHLGF
ncbi:hypothetical protein SUGI_0543980 [Cryptomeria japonica]|nr:hypothetical protein SUGI_0543980 [Cryptomeria japonica]